MTKVAYTVALVLLLVGCGGGGSSDEGLDSQNDSTSLDISLPPPAEYNITRYKPTTDTSWQWQLTGVINTSYSVDLYDIDLFDTSIEIIEALKDDGKRVICYFIIFL